MANFLTKTWDKVVKKPFDQAREAVGLKLPTIPDAAKPVIDQSKIQDLANYQGINRGNVDRWTAAGNSAQPLTAQNLGRRPGTPMPQTVNVGQLQPGQTPGGPGYFTPETYNPVQPDQIATPTMTPEQERAYTARTQTGPSEADIGGLALQNVSRGINPDTATYQTAAQKALQERMATNTPTIEGYDPARKALALQEMTAGLDTQQKDALDNMTEQLSRSGILNSSVGQAQLAKVRSAYDQQKANALAKVNLEDLAAARTDRYANADQAAARMSQISSLASTGQGLGLQAGQFQAGLNTADNSVAAQNAAYGREGRAIDRADINNLAQQNFNNQSVVDAYNRQGRQMGTDQGWQTYNAQNADAANRAGLTNQASLYNIGARDTAKQREYGAYQTDINNLAGNTAGSIYTPQSQASADEYAKRVAMQQQAIGNTLGIADKAAQAYTAYTTGVKPKAANIYGTATGVKPKKTRTMKPVTA